MRKIQHSIKPTDEIEMMLKVIMKDTGLGITALFNNWVLNEFNRYYKEKK